MKLTAADLVFLFVAIAFFIASLFLTYSGDDIVGLLMIPIGCFFLILATTSLDYRPPDKDQFKK